MSYGNKYFFNADNLLNESYRIDFDFLDFVGFATEIKTTSKFLQLRSTNGDEDRLTPILGTEAIIEIDVTEEDSITIADLIATHDSDIKVTATRIDQATGQEYIHFQGFVVVEDNNQPFHDKPYILTVRALDGVGLLKGVDLQDTDGKLFTGSQTVMQWIGQILYKTNQDVPVRVYFNFFPKDFSEITALTEITLNAITFAQGFPATGTDPSVDINADAADDCYTALEKIMRCLRCRLFFEDGRFMIVNLKEYTNPNYQYAEYTFGTPSSGIVPMNPSAVGTGLYKMNIGKNEMIFPCENDALLYLKLAYKYIKLTYNYDQSLNKICNQDLTQGDRNATYDEVISSSVIDPTISPVVNLNTLGYDLYCFDHFNGTAGLGFQRPYPTNSPDQVAFIRQVNDALGYNIQRFAVIHTTALNNNVTYIRSNRLLIDENDVLQLGYEWRTRVSVAAIQSFVNVYLYGVDGSFWALQTVNDDTVPPNNPTWVVTDANFTVGSGGSPPVISDYSTDSTDWTSAGVNQNIGSFAKTPVSGSLEIIFSAYHGSVTDPVEFWYRNIQLTIIPYLQGSYQQLKGDYNFSSSNENIKQSLKEDVQISDSPKRYFKGALLQQDGETLVNPDWHRRGVTESFRFAQAMERIMYNMLSRMIYKIEGSFKGITYRSDDLLEQRPAGYINSYFFIDSDFPTKKFILTSFDIDVYQGQGRRVFVEIQNDANDSGWDPPDNFKFDYIFQ